MQRITLDKSSVDSMYSEDIISVLQNMISDELSKDDDKVNTDFVDECVNALLEIEQDRDKAFVALVPLFSDEEFLRIVSGKKGYFKRLNKFGRAAVIAAVVAASTFTVNAAVAEITGVNLLKEAGVKIQRSIESLTDGGEKKESESPILPVDNEVKTSEMTDETTDVTETEEKTATVRVASALPKKISPASYTPENETDSTSNRNSTTQSEGIDRDYDDEPFDEETTSRETTTKVTPAIPDGESKPAKVTLDSLEASFDGFKFDYIYGEELSYDGLTLTAVYSNETRKVIPLSECDYTTSLNMNITADYTLRVIYNSCVVKIPITVRPDEETRGSTNHSNDDFEYLVTDSGAFITKYKGSAENLNLAKVDGSKVYAICAGVFENSNIKTVSAPNVKKVFNNAFKNAKSLEAVGIENATYIGDSAFEGCEKLSSMGTSNAQTLGKAAYKNSGITSINIPSGMNSVPEALCEGCTSLESVNLSNAEIIENSAFEDCTALVDITGMGGVKKIGSFAFYGDESAEIDEAPAQLESVGDNGLAYCKKMALKALPSTVREIGEYAFMYVTKMESANIQNSITVIPAGAFWGTHLKTLTLPDGLKSIEQAAFMSTVITKVTIPASVERIESKGLYSLSRLTVTFEGDTQLEEDSLYINRYLKFIVKANTKPEEFAIENEIDYETSN